MSSPSPNNALQRTAHGGHVFSVLYVLRRHEPSLSLETLGDYTMRVLPRLFLIVWLPVFLLVQAFGLFVVWGSGTYRLAYHYTQTQGVSLGASPYEHGQSIYRFQVGGRNFQAEGSRGHGYIPAGESITVYYVAADPQLSCLDDPPSHFSAGLFLSVFFALLAATAFQGFIVSAQRASIA